MVVATRELSVDQLNTAYFDNPMILRDLKTGGLCI